MRVSLAIIGGLLLAGIGNAQTRSSFLAVDLVSNVTVTVTNAGLDYELKLGS